MGKKTSNKKKIAVLGFLCETSILIRSQLELFNDVHILLGDIKKHRWRVVLIQSMDGS